MAVTASVAPGEYVWDKRRLSMGYLSKADGVKRGALDCTVPAHDARQLA